MSGRFPSKGDGPLIALLVMVFMAALWIATVALLNLSGMHTR